jgi:ParB family chromosome partitioning protein
MLSGHRRKAAYKLLAKSDETFRKLPCRIIDNIDDSKALALLHSANYFTRELTALERAAATKALESEVVKLRQVNPELKGVRTRDIKASILKAQTGREVSGRTVAHHEKIASLIENKLSPSWKDLASKGEISDSKIQDLASNDFEVQEVLYKKWTKNNVADIDSKAKESHRQTKKIRNLIADLKKVASQSNLTASDKALVYKELKELTLNFL